MFAVPANEEKHDKKCQKTVSNIPGPYSLPIFGTRWIFSYIGSYKLNKIHDAYRGKKFGLHDQDVGFVNVKFGIFWIE